MGNSNLQRWLRSAKLCLLVALVAGLASAVPAKTTVQDVVFLADGSRFSGRVEVEWPTFTASDQSIVARGKVTVVVVNGVLQVQLVPTTDASLGAAYSIRYVSGRNTVFTERWMVPPSTSTVNLRVVRGQGAVGGSSGGPGGNTVITINDVQGLAGELSNRPVRGSSFAINRVMRSSSTGQLESVDGEATDCVRVDGSSGACGTGGTSTGTTFNGSPATNVVIGEELDWIDQGGGTFRVQVGALVARTTSGSDAPVGACVAGNVHVTATTFYYCDSTGAWKTVTASGGTQVSPTVFPSAGWTARNSTNVSWTISSDGLAIIATVGGSDQPTAAVYCRAHSGNVRYDVDLMVLRQGTTGANLSAGIGFRSTGGYRSMTLGQGSLGTGFDVSGVNFSDSSYAMSGANAGGQAPWHLPQSSLGVFDDGTNVGFVAGWRRGTEARQNPSEVCLAVSGKPTTQVVFANWRQQ